MSEVSRSLRSVKAQVQDTLGAEPWFLGMGRAEGELVLMVLYGHRPDAVQALRNLGVSKQVRVRSMREIKAKPPRRAGKRQELEPDQLAELLEAAQDRR